MIRLYPVVRVRQSSRTMRSPSAQEGNISMAAEHPGAWEGTSMPNHETPRSGPVWGEPKPSSDRRVLHSVDGREFPSARYEMLPIRLADVVVETPFQRAFRPAVAQAIIDDFDPEILDPIVVSMREDCVLYMIRGQHRRFALLELFGPEAMATAKVWFGLTPEEEAKIFAVEDTMRARIKPGERWTASLEAKLEPYASIDALVRSRGWTADPKASRKGNIRAVGALLRAYRQAGSRALIDTLDALRALDWGEGEPMGEVVEGLAGFLSMYRPQLQWTVAESVKWLQKVGYYSLLDRANVHAKANKAPKGVAVRIMLEDSYNKGKQPQNRLKSVSIVRSLKATERDRDQDGRFLKDVPQESSGRDAV